MEKEFVHYEEALDLKHLGFDKPCIRAFRNRDGEESLMGLSTWQNFTTHDNHDGFAAAPTYSQAFKWFREKYNLHTEITWSPSYEYDSGNWADAIYEITFTDVSETKDWVAERPDWQRANGKQLTYEGAELVALKELIKIAKEKQNGK